MLSLLRLTTMVCLEIKPQESGSYSDSDPSECQRAVEAAAQIRHVDQDPPPDEGKLEFPITHDPKEWKGLTKRRLSALPTSIQDAIERVQPYNLQSSSTDETIKSTNRSLGILNDLARKDRH